MDSTHKVKKKSKECVFFCDFWHKSKTLQKVIAQINLKHRPKPIFPFCTVLFINSRLGSLADKHRST